MGAIVNSPTKRAPDGWWAPHFGLDLSEELGSVSLVGSRQPPVTQAVRRNARFLFECFWRNEHERKAVVFSTVPAVIICPFSFL